MKVETREENRKITTDEETIESPGQDMIKRVKVKDITTKLTLKHCSDYINTTSHSIALTRDEYWSSTEAHKLFNVSYDESVTMVLERN